MDAIFQGCAIQSETSTAIAELDVYSAHASVTLHIYFAIL